MIKYYYTLALLFGYLDKTEAIELELWDSNEVDDLTLIDLEMKKLHKTKKANKS